MLDKYRINLVTADYKRVRDGTVFVDFSKRITKSQLLNIYKSGASIILTDKRLVNNRLPVVYVKELEDEYILLLEEFYKLYLDDFSFIGIDSDNSEIIASMIQCILLNSKNGKRMNTSFKNVYENYELRTKAALLMKDVFDNLRLSRENDSLISPLICYKPFVTYNYLEKFYFDSLIIQKMQGEYSIDDTNTILSYLGKDKPIIINIDSDNTYGFFEKLIQNPVITYGLSQKASVTATSIVSNDTTTFNFCLQRQLITKSGNIIDCFEEPITFNSSSSDYIYCALAAITCALYFDYDLATIKHSLKNYYGLDSYYNYMDYGRYKVFDHNCNCINDYNNVFQFIGSLDYKRLHILLRLNEDIDIKYHRNLAEIINQWSRNLNLYSVIFGYFDANYETAKISRKHYNIYLDCIDEGISLIKYKSYHDDLIQILSQIVNKDDLVAVLGPGKMDIIHSIDFNDFCTKL